MVSEQTKASPDSRNRQKCLCQWTRICKSSKILSIKTVVACFSAKKILFWGIRNHTAFVNTFLLCWQQRKKIRQFIFAALIFLFPRNYFFLSAWKFFLSYKKVFITNFVTCVRNFVTRITKFVICVTKFLTKNFRQIVKTFKDLMKNFPGLVKIFCLKRFGADFCFLKELFYVPQL